MSLTDFDVLGEGRTDDETGEVLVPGDPRRTLLREHPDGTETHVFVRMNVPLLTAAASLPVVRLEPVPRPDEALGDGRSLAVTGHLRNLELYERIGADLESSGCPARFVAFETGHGRRDFYFATEDVDCIEAVARAAAASLDHELSISRHRLADVSHILPIELIGDLGLDVPADARERRTRFEFWGSPDSLPRLRQALEKQGFDFVEVERAASELRMAKVVPVDGPGFNAVLREIAPLARSLRCSYRGTETVDGFDQFALTRPLPERYAAPGSGGFWKRLFS